MTLARVRDLTTRWHWTRIYERVEKARREGSIVTQPLEDPLEEPAFGIDEAGRVELRAWVCAWLDEYVETSTASIRNLLTASQLAWYLETPIETRERGSIIYSLDVVLRLEDVAAARDLLCEAAPLRFGR